MSLLKLILAYVGVLLLVALILLGAVFLILCMFVTTTIAFKWAIIITIAITLISMLA